MWSGVTSVIVDVTVILWVSVLLSEERKLILDFNGPVPSPIHYRETYYSVFIFIFPSHLITVLLLLLLLLLVVLLLLLLVVVVIFSIPVIVNNPLCLLQIHLCLTNYCWCAILWKKYSEQNCLNLKESCCLAVDDFLISAYAVCSFSLVLKLWMISPVDNDIISTFIFYANYLIQYTSNYVLQGRRVSVSVQFLGGSKTKKVNNNKKEVQLKKIKKEEQKSP